MMVRHYYNDIPTVLMVVYSYSIIIYACSLYVTTPSVYLHHVISASYAQTYLLLRPVMIIKLSLDEYDHQISYVHVK